MITPEPPAPHCER